MCWELIRKDLEENARGLALYALSSVLLPIVYQFLRYRGTNNEGFLGLVCAYLGFGAPMLFVFWFVGNEKVKGTLRLLRTLPISTAEIVQTKAAAVWGVSIALTTFVLLVEPPLLGLLGKPLAPVGWQTLAWIDLCAVLFGSTCVAIHCYFDHKIALQATYWILIALSGAVVLAEKALGNAGVSLDKQMGRLSGVLPALGGMAIVLCVAAVLLRFSARVLDMRDWADLED